MDGTGALQMDFQLQEDGTSANLGLPVVTEASGSAYRFSLAITTSRLRGVATGSLLTVPGVKRY
jgi:hypothetical protein